MHGLAPGLRVSEGADLPSGAVSILYLRRPHWGTAAAMSHETYGLTRDSRGHTRAYGRSRDEHRVLCKTKLPLPNNLRGKR